MNSLAHEYVFRNVCRVLKKRYNRDISQYTFEAWEDSNGKIKSLHGLLIESQIPHALSGLPANFYGDLPFRFVIRGYGPPTPAGLFFIYPDTKREVILASFRLVGEHGNRSHHVIAYRDKNAFTQLKEDLSAFHRKKLRQDGMIKVYDGDDIPLPAVTWDDIVLPPEIKADIRCNIEEFIDGKAIYHRLNIPYRRGFLLAGPPGNGKTFLMKMIASTYREFKFILFKYNNSSYNYDIDNVFALAREVEPSILCFEDLDSLFKGGITLSHFLNKVDGFESSDGIMIFATTNHPEEIDPALTNRPSRFDRFWLFSNPDYRCRLEMLKRLFGQFVSYTLIERLAEETNDFSMVYLKELYISASLAAIRVGKSIPDEETIDEALGLLRKQFKTAERQFSSFDKEIGFGVGLRDD